MPIRPLDGAVLNGPIIINAIIYAELSVRYERIEDFHEVLEDSKVTFAVMDAAGHGPAPGAAIGSHPCGIRPGR